MAIEIGALIESRNGKNKVFYGFVSGTEDVTDRWNRTLTYYTATPLVYKDGTFPEKPKPFKYAYVDFAMPDLVRLTCLLRLKELENHLINAQLKDSPYFSNIRSQQVQIAEARTRYDQVFAQLNNYIDPRGI